MKIGIVDGQRLTLECLSATIMGMAPDIEVAIQTTDWLGFSLYEGPALDAVLLDVELHDSIPLTCKLNSMRSTGINVVLMSSAAEPHVVNSALKSGALSFVTRHEGADAIVAALQAASRGEAYMTPTTQVLIDEAECRSVPKLSNMERLCMALVAGGAPMKSVAVELKVAEGTAKKYLKNVRTKYREFGIDIGSKISLREQALLDGVITAQASTPRRVITSGPPVVRLAIKLPMAAPVLVSAAPIAVPITMPTALSFEAQMAEPAQPWYETVPMRSDPRHRDAPSGGHGRRALVA